MVYARKMYKIILFSLLRQFIRALGKQCTVEYCLSVSNVPTDGWINKNYGKQVNLKKISLKIIKPFTTEQNENVSRKLKETRFTQHTKFTMKANV